jgi:hypothetical protein
MSHILSGAGGSGADAEAGDREGRDHGEKLAGGSIQFASRASTERSRARPRSIDKLS